MKIELLVDVSKYSTTIHLDNFDRGVNINLVDKNGKELSYYFQRKINVNRLHRIIGDHKLEEE